MSILFPFWFLLFLLASHAFARFGNGNIVSLYTRNTNNDQQKWKQELCISLPLPRHPNPIFDYIMHNLPIMV